MNTGGNRNAGDEEIALPPMSSPLETISVSFSPGNTNAQDEGSIEITPRIPKRRRRRRRCVKMDYRSTTKVELEIQKSMLLHTLAAQHFRWRHFWFFEIQEGLYTMISSILAFLISSEYIICQWKSRITLIVGTASIVVAFLQSMSCLCCYDSHALLHQSVATDLKEIKNNLRLLKLKRGYVENDSDDQQQNYGRDEEEHGEEYNDYDDYDYEDDDDDEGAFQSIQAKFEQTLHACKAPIPIKISQAFSGLESKIILFGTASSNEYLVKTYGQTCSLESLKFAHYDMVSTQIMEYPFFPAFLPRVSRTVDKTMKRFRTEVHRASNFYAEG